MILAIDTALPLLSVALIDEGKTVAALSMFSEGSRNEKLLPAIDWIIGEAGIAPGQIDLYAVTRGPGSFTGVRVGLATVQGIALARQSPICALSTHEAAAELARGSRVLVRSDAGRGEYYATLFEPGLPAETHLASPEQLASLRERAEVEIDLTGDGAGARPSRIGGSDINVALWLARAAQRVSSEGRLSEYSDTTPLYVRLAEADVKLRQKQNAPV